MKNREKLLDDLARAAGSFVDITQKTKSSIKHNIQLRATEVADTLDLAVREDLEQLTQRVDKLQKENEQLKQRIAALEENIKE